jgi:hypothetical protein
MLPEEVPSTSLSFIHPLLYLEKLELIHDISTTFSVTGHLTPLPQSACRGGDGLFCVDWRPPGDGGVTGV